MTPRSPLLAALQKTLQKVLLSTQHSAPSASRRRFVSQSVALTAGAALALPGCSKVGDLIGSQPLGQQPTKNKKNQPSIAIIGAGIAGLNSAYQLQKAGYSSQVYEASGRLGGRMYTATNLLGQGLTTELGGEFIDSVHKDMIKLTREFNLELIDTKAAPQATTQYQAYFIHGRHYSEQEVIDAFLPVSEKIKRDQQQMSAIITADSHSAFDAMLDQMSIAEYFDRIQLHGWLRTLLDVAYETEYGQPIEKQTALNFLWLISPKVANGTFEIFGISDERYKIRGGNQELTNRMAKALETPVLLHHQLVAISYTKNGASLTFQTPQGLSTIEAQYVLITIPFTMLRQVAVQPEWPDWKRQAIFDIGYGNNSKVLLGFNSRYWIGLGYEGYFFADNGLQSGWDNSALQAPVTGGITVFSGGQTALDAGTISLPNLVESHLQKLNEMYPGAMQEFSGQADRFIWPNYPYSFCSYTCFKPGQYTSIADNEIKPVGPLYFAGEHCSYDFQGFMNGGAETGRRAADAIIAEIIKTE